MNAFIEKSISHKFKELDYNILEFNYKHYEEEPVYYFQIKANINDSVVYFTSISDFSVDPEEVVQDVNVSIDDFFIRLNSTDSKVLSDFIYTQFINKLMFKFNFHAGFYMYMDVSFSCHLSEFCDNLIELYNSPAEFISDFDNIDLSELANTIRDIQNDN